MSNTEATFADPERVDLIETVAAKISSLEEAMEEITFRTTWACMWLADKEGLEEPRTPASHDLFEPLKTFEERLSGHVSHMATMNRRKTPITCMQGCELLRSRRVRYDVLWNTRYYRPKRTLIRCVPHSQC